MSNYNQLINKAKTFYNSNQFNNAKGCLLELLEKYKLDTEIKSKVYLLLADVLNKINSFKYVEEYLLKYLKINPSDSTALNLIANNFSKVRRYEAAEKYYKKSIKFDKNNETAIINLAILLENLGRNLDSINFYNKALSINPNNLGVIYNMSKLDKKIVDEKKIDLIKKTISLKNVDYFNIAAGYFLLANLDYEKKDVNKEIFFLEQANKFSFKHKEKINMQALNYWLNIIPKKFNKLIYEKNGNDTDYKNFYPIFIIGLPRSGSTLTETIISSGKNKIEDLGETNLVNWSLLNNYREDLFKNSNENFTINIDINIIADKLISSYDNLGVPISDKKVLLLDKSLENFYYVDLILKIFPNAKFIHTYRNLEDNIFAIYKEFLSQISWSHSLKDIIKYINNYLKIMDIQKNKNKDCILSVSLEELTNNPEKISKKIYNFCNLDWDESCLNFQKRKNLFSKTASNNQIRSGIKKYNANKYGPYYYLLKDYKKNFDWIKLHTDKS